MNFAKDFPEVRSSCSEGEVWGMICEYTVRLVLYHRHPDDFLTYKTPSAFLGLCEGNPLENSVNASLVDILHIASVN